MNCIHVEFEVPGNNFLSAGSASDSVKSTLKKLGVPAPAIRRVAIAMYEAEINMVIHAGGGRCYADIFDDHIRIVMKDEGNGIADVDLAMQEGYSTATDDVRNLGFEYQNVFRQIENRHRSRRRHDAYHRNRL